MRTSFGIKFVLGMPLPQYSLPPFVTVPFRFAWNPQEDSGAPTASAEEENSGQRHPICKVMAWEQRLLSEEDLNQS